MTTFLLLLLACTAAEPTDSASGDGGGVSSDGGGSASDGGGRASDGGGVDPDTLNGSVPDKALPAPEFVAINRDGAARDREDLLGHPTVMWFYPAANTAG